MRLDEYIVTKSPDITRSQAQDLIKRAKVRLDTKIITKPAWQVKGNERLQIIESQRYVSRAGYKLASVAGELKLDFDGKVVLDVGSSTGGFSDFALQSGAKLVVAVDVGTDQLHPKLRGNTKIRLYEKTDIRYFKWPKSIDLPDIIVIDVSFISLSKILPSLAKFCHKQTLVVAMAKPQFEAEGYKLNNGVVKNSRQRREILSRLESWLTNNNWLIVDKRDSGLAGAKGNLERFFLLKTIGN